MENINLYQNLKFSFAIYVIIRFLSIKLTLLVRHTVLYFQYENKDKSRMLFLGLNPFVFEALTIMPRLRRRCIPRHCSRENILLSGHAFGGGAFLAIAHDYRVMREDRGWISVNEIILKYRIRGVGQELLK